LSSIFTKKLTIISRNKNRQLWIYKGNNNRWVKERRRGGDYRNNNFNTKTTSYKIRLQVKILGH